MFSANENLMLRQHKRRIVDFVESTMPENALDMGTTVMVMQVSCKAPGCVPLETAIIIVFPNMGSSSAAEELVPGLPESGQGGSYKTKVLKPMAEVTKEDVLDVLPPAFEGGKRSMEKLCIRARDVMIGQITQLFGEEDDDTVQDRKAMAEFLQQCLKNYIDQDCKPPEIGEPFAASLEVEEEKAERLNTASALPGADKKSSPSSSSDGATVSVSSSGTSSNGGNFVIRRDTAPAAKLGGMKGDETKQQYKEANNPHNKVSNNISSLFQRQHAPGIRQPGCPCCDPDNPSNVVDSIMML